jgi:hypothetical protein
MIESNHLVFLGKSEPTQSTWGFFILAFYLMMTFYLKYSINEHFLDLMVGNELDFSCYIHIFYLKITFHLKTNFERLTHGIKA